MIVNRAIIILESGAEYRLLGLSLLKRLILNANEAGLKEFWLFHPDKQVAERELVRLSEDQRIFDRQIKFRVISSEEIRNSDLVLESSDFVLIFQDNLVLAPELFNNLLRLPAIPEKDLALVEFKMPDGEIRAVPGMLLVRGTKVFSILNSLAVSRADLSISGLVGTEENVSLAKVLVEARFCLLVKDKGDLKRAEKYLLQTGRKPTDGFISRNINRRVSLFLTRYLLKLAVTPIQISVVTFLIGLTSVVFIAMGRKWLIPGAILFELASVIDGCDGENARLTYRVSKFGGAFDITADAITFVSFFAALPVGLFRTTGEQLWLYIGGLALFSMVAFYLQLIAYARKTGIGRNIIAVVKEIEASVSDPDFQNWYDRLAARIAFVYRRDFFATAAFVLICTGQAKLTMILVAILASLEALYFASFSHRKLSKRNSDELQPTGV
ncbi:MAG: CDP-alcohol phosphatidyltransferase family protein [Candidatus Aminicenantes bacterium]|nr:CDP-alcohol phosphatidyltransferase family protein [Candidatus Aminicenantes bacterium]